MEYTASEKVLNALRVIARDPKIRSFLQENDPKALEQVDAALTTAFEEPIRPGVYQHFKGDKYRVLGEIVLDGPRDKMVLYVPLYGKGEPTARNKKEFLSFVPVEFNGEPLRRFTFLHE